MLAERPPLFAVLKGCRKKYSRHDPWQFGYFTRNFEDKAMFKVKTFGTEIRPLRTMHELTNLDATVNNFLSGENITRVVSISDVATTDDKGETIGIIRVVCYEKGENG